MQWVKSSRTPCGSPTRSSHTTWTHTDAITHCHHLHIGPTQPIIFSWAVAEPPYTSVGSWLTSCDDTPTWSPFSSSTERSLPQTPPPVVLFMSQENTLLSQSVSEQEVSWGEKLLLRVSVHCSDGVRDGRWQLIVKGKMKNKRGYEKWKQSVWKKHSACKDWMMETFLFYVWREWCVRKVQGVWVQELEGRDGAVQECWWC